MGTYYNPARDIVDGKIGKVLKLSGTYDGYVVQLQSGQALYAVIEKHGPEGYVAVSIDSQREFDEVVVPSDADGLDYALYALPQQNP